MRRLLLKILYIIAVFFLSLVIFVHFSGGEREDQTVVTGSAKLPLIKLCLPDGTEAATLHGYLDEMNVRAMRGTVYPIGTDRLVTLRITTYGEKLNELTFELRDITGENLVEQAAVVDRSVREYGDIEARFSVKDLLVADTEYMLILRATTPLGPTAWYSRVTLLSDENVTYVSDAVRFARNFHELTFDRERGAELKTWLEPNREGDNTSFARVNIHSSVSQVTWGDLPILTHDAPTIQINDIRGDIVTLKLTGSMVISTEGGRQLPMDLTEYYRLRRGRERLYLLDYERTAEYRFSGETVDFERDRIDLHINPVDFPFIENESGDTIAFAAGDRIFCYRKPENELSVLFSFSDKENADERCTYRAHDYHLLRIEQNGDVRFLVAGYMNRGAHEGRVGISLCHYDVKIKEIRELAFLQVDISPELLCAEIRRLAHVSREGGLYLMLGDDVILLDASEGQVHTVIEGAARKLWFRSDSGALFARSEGVPGRRISVSEFNTGETSEVSAEPGTQVIPLGFTQEDLVYGIVHDEDILRDQTGSEVYAMKTVRICDAYGEILENYSSEGFYVVDAQVDGKQIRLSRVRLNEETGFYEDAQPDQIVNTLEMKSRINRVLTTASDTWKKTVYIDCRQSIRSASLKVVTPELIAHEEEPLYYEGAGTAEKYYVYAGDGTVKDIFINPAEAVSRADELGAAVIDGNDRTVWEKRVLTSRHQISEVARAAAQIPVLAGMGSAEACLKLMLEQRGVNRDITEMLGEGLSLSGALDAALEGCRALTLTGCDLTAVLYYVGRDTPVLVSMRDGSALLLIGFTDSELIVVDPALDANERVYRITRSQGIKLFKENGNRFITWYENEPAL